MDKDYVFKAMERILSVTLTIIMGFIAYQSANWTANIESLTKSVTELNLQMRGMFTDNQYSKEKLQTLGLKLEIHDADIKDLDRRMIKQENKK